METNYWNNFYSKENTTLNMPSQFAAFVLNEFSNYDTFIDIGCGNARDAVFFSNFNKTVIGIDGSTEVIERNTKLYPHIQFHNINFSSKENQPLDIKNSIVYSRFFIHALNEQEEDNFIDFCKASFTGFLCLEYRTIQDEGKTKVTQEHYRRYIDVGQFHESMFLKGFELVYTCQGTGYAKYKDDDAFVARSIFKI